MKIKTHLLKVFGIIGIFALPHYSVFAVDLSQVPLYAGGGAKPNVLFVIDDSGSMAAPVMKTPAAFSFPQLNELDHTTFGVGPFDYKDDFTKVMTELNDPKTYSRGGAKSSIEAESMQLSAGVVTASNNAGYSGSGFADFPATGGEIGYTFNLLPLGKALVSIRYANGGATNRYLTLIVGTVSYPIEFKPTGSWTTWVDVEQVVDVTNATSRVVLRGLATAGPNVDSVSLSGRVMDAGSVFVSLCSGVNLLAYNPAKTYRPWAGHANSTFPNAQRVPHQPDKGTENLTNAGYVPWVDANGNGVYDFGECGAYMSEGRLAFNLTRLVKVSTFNAAQKQNFANWFTYHRSREYAMKAGISPVLADLRVRAGLSTIHIHNEAHIEWGMNIQDVDNFSNPALQANKDAFMAEFFDILSVFPSNFGGTPLRRTLENAGFYFQLDNASAKGKPEAKFLPDLTTSPFLPANQGGECQASHMVLVTDGYQYEFDGQGPRFNWGNVDGAIGGLHSDGLENTLADIAMYFATEDAAPNIPGKQVVHTHLLGFGVIGNLSRYPTTLAEKNWPTDANRLVGRIGSLGEYPDSLDDGLHAAFNGGGRFMSATDADSLYTEMQLLMEDISTTNYSGTASAVSFDKNGLDDSTTQFRALYDMENWSGQLNAYNFDASTGVVGSEKWEASARLALKNADNKRKIVTFNGVKGAPFVAPSNINAPSLTNGELNQLQLSDLLADKPAAVDTAQYLQDIIEYFRGDGDGYTTNPNFRNRTKLGDIVQSSPVYVSAPRGFYANSFEAASYLDFAKAKQNRTPMLYVGANDGMLHGFNANTGDEVFAYIPQGVYSATNKQGLHLLAKPNYSHVTYVDETPVTADVYIGNEWRTYLAGGLGRGGKSVYVLDITDPASIGSESAMASKVVVKEFTDTHMGYSYGTPLIAKMNDGEWVAIFGNGYNNATDGKAYLYVLYLDGFGPGGVDHIKVGPLGGNAVGSVTNNSCENAASDCNGLSAPTVVDLNADGKVDRVYAGDLFGNVWAFDFTKDSSGDTVNASNVASVIPVVAHEGSLSKTPLFTACRNALLPTGQCAKADRQPVTTKPSVTANLAHQGKPAEAPNLMVYIGTGKYLGESDVLDMSIQGFYGVWDSGKNEGQLQPSNLTAQTLSLDAKGNRTMTTVNPVSYIRAADDLTGNGNYGWKLPLVSGEKVINNPEAVNQVVLFTTRISSNNLCSRKGDGFIMALDLKTGGKPDFVVFPDQGADIGIPLLSGAEVTHGQGNALDWFVPDPVNDIKPVRITIQTEPKRAPRRSSWTIMK